MRLDLKGGATVDSESMNTKKAKKTSHRMTDKPHNNQPNHISIAGHWRK
jgi:hypothetical protein